MKTKPIPAIVMLLAGFVTCIMSIYNHLSLKTFTKTLLLVLIIFYLFGIIIKIVLDKNFVVMKEEETLSEDEVDSESEEEQAEDKVEDKVEGEPEEEPESEEE